MSYSAALANARYRCRMLSVENLSDGYTGKWRVEPTIYFFSATDCDISKEQARKRNQRMFICYRDFLDRTKVMDAMLQKSMHT